LEIFMASTITLSGDWLVNLGNRNQTFGTGNLGVYATNGIAVTPAQVGLGAIDSLVIDPAGGYVFEYVASTGKVKAYISAGVTPAGTVAVPVVTVTGGQAAGPALQITPDSVAGVLGKTSATTVAIPGATFGIGAQTFTGTPVAAAGLAEVTNSTNLAGVTFNFRAIGR